MVRCHHSTATYIIITKKIVILIITAHYTMITQIIYKVILFRMSWLLKQMWRAHNIFERQKNSRLVQGNSTILRYTRTVYTDVVYNTYVKKKMVKIQNTQRIQADIFTSVSRVYCVCGPKRGQYSFHSIRLHITRHVTYSLDNIYSSIWPIHIIPTRNNMT